MKKYLIFLLVGILLLVAFLYARLFTKQAQFQQTMAASADSALYIKDFDRSKVRIVTADTDTITVSLNGSADDILKMLQSESGSLVGIDFSDYGSDVSGTITIPKGTLLDVSLSDNADLEISDGTGQRQLTGKNSFLIDSNSLSSFAVGNSGQLVLDGWGSLIVWDDQKWELLGNNNGAGQEGGEQEGAAYCGVGSQSIRNYCCDLQSRELPPPACDGIGRWYFKNADRACAYECQSTENDAPEEKVECGGEGVQTARDNCCALQHTGQYQGCVGSWAFNNASRNCEFACSNGLPPAEEGGDGDGGGQPAYGDPVSDYCVTLSEASDRNVCCNDALKNNLSSGPHPGYPDCIGTWDFDVEKGCAFRCAEYTEMMKILEDLRQKAANQP